MLRCMKVGVGGPRNSGKSTFCVTLFRYLNRDSRVQVGFGELDVWDQTVRWLLDDTGTVERKDEEATMSDAVDEAQSLYGRSEDVLLCDLPGRLEPPIDQLMEPLDMIILLGRRDSLDELESWIERAEDNDVSIFSIFITHLEEEPQATWDPSTGRGILRGLDRDCVDQTYLEGIPDDTLVSTRLLSAELRKLSCAA